MYVEIKLIICNVLSLLLFTAFLQVNWSRVEERKLKPPWIPGEVSGKVDRTMYVVILLVAVFEIFNHFPGFD